MLYRHDGAARGEMCESWDAPRPLEQSSVVREPLRVQGGFESKWRPPRRRGGTSELYATADTQILTTKSQILKAAVSAVSGLVSGSALVETCALASLFGIWWSKRLWYEPVSAPNLAYLPLDLEVKTFVYFTGRNVLHGHPL